MNHFLRNLIPFLFCAASVLTASFAHAEDIYVAQTALGANTGADAANAHSKAWMDAAGSWGSGAGQIGPGDTVHLVGTLTGIAVQASGVASSPITIYFEPAAKLSSPNSDLMYIANRSYLVIDGGSNGILENTANGTTLAYKTVTRGINASGISNVTIKNLTIRNLYVHTSAADSGIDFTTGGGIYANGYGPEVVIQNCSFSDMCWCVIMFGSAGGHLTVTGCDFVNYDHGIGGVAAASGTVAGFTATFNHFGSTANWDTTANTYHHDGIHTYWGSGGGIPNAVITNNLFDGDWGKNNTAHLFFEQNWNTHSSAEASGWLIANNVHIQAPGNYLNNGFMIAIGDNATIANNTYLGASVPLSSGIGIAGSAVVLKNNLISGVNRFVDASGAFASADRNIYAAVVPSGNTSFRYLGTNIASFTAWKTATGQESASSQQGSIAINSDGSLPVGSAAIDAGTALTNIISMDKIGTLRPQGGAWDVGAYEYIGGGLPATLAAPSNARIVSSP